jgi:hypothetical protein
MTKKEDRIFVSLTGGLGNQLFQLAAGLAQPKEQLVLLSIFGKPRSRKNGKPDVTEFTLPPGAQYSGDYKESWLTSKAAGYLLRSGIYLTRLQKISGLLGVAKFAGAAILSASLRTIVSPHASTGIGFSPIDRLGKTPLLLGYFQTYRWASSPRVNALLREMRIERPGPGLIERMALAELESPLIVHVRLGDYKSEKDFGLPSESYYAKAVNLMMKTGNYSKIWLFSDEPELALSRIPSEFHDRVRIIAEIDNSPASTLELMRHGRGYVVANSSFSWWGAFLTHDNSAKVVVPSPWFSNLNDPLDLIPETWIQLSAK